jgi:hypothetical protein
MTSDSADAKCPYCGGRAAQKLVSRVAKYRTEDQRIDEMADRLENMGDPESPSEMREIVRDMGRAMDDDMADEMEAMYEADLEGTSDDDG